SQRPGSAFGQAGCAGETGRRGRPEGADPHPHSRARRSLLAGPGPLRWKTAAAAAAGLPAALVGLEREPEGVSGLEGRGRFSRGGGSAGGAFPRQPPGDLLPAVPVVSSGGQSGRSGEAAAGATTRRAAPGHLAAAGARLRSRPSGGGPGKPPDVLVPPGPRDVPAGPYT